MTSDQTQVRLDATPASTMALPCLSTIYDERSTRLSDMGSEDRRPRFAERAMAQGIGSMMAVQLFVEDENLGALNLHIHTRESCRSRSGFGSSPSAPTDCIAS